VIERIKTSLKERKVRVFLMFLLFSSLAWFINNLSERYTGNVVFNIEYVDTPDNLLLLDASKNEIDVKLDATGFQFLAFNFVTKTIKIDVSSIKTEEDTYFIPKSTYKKQIEKQLSNSMKLLGVDTDDAIFFNFQEVISKEVSVVSKIKLNLAQNYLLDGDVEIHPKVIQVKGPKSEIDSIKVIKTIAYNLDEIKTNFSENIQLYKSEALSNTTFSEREVVVKGKVAKFSERILEVPVRVLNLPEGLNVKTFPDQVSVLCNAKVDVLKTLEGSNFRVTVDYNDIKSDRKKLMLELSKKPENLHSVSISEKEVTYILTRE